MLKKHMAEIKEPVEIDKVASMYPSRCHTGQTNEHQMW